MAGLIRRLAPLGFVLALMVVIGATSASGYVRPKAASPIKVSLVPAFNACSPPANRTHGPPLAAPSCNPPMPSSQSVTTASPVPPGGDNANLVGMFAIKTKVGAPGPPNDADMLLQGSISDVRCLPGTTTCGTPNTDGGPDYTGQLQATFQMRITDRWNAVAAGGGPDPATVVDLPIPTNFACASTPRTAEGASCTANTSFNVIVPGAVKEGKRSVYDTGQVQVFDGGSDGMVNTTPNTTFLRQGVFVP